MKTKGKIRVKLEAFWVRRVSRGTLSIHANVANILEGGHDILSESYEIWQKDTLAKLLGPKINMVFSRM